MPKKYLIPFAALILLVLFLSFPESARSVDGPERPRVGTWVTVFTPEKIFFSKAGADKLIKTCREAGIDDIYLQVYRAGNAYYDSDLTDKTAYNKFSAAFGADPIKYILSEAKKNGLNVHAWVNLLSLAQNDKAPIVLSCGDSVLTRDQHGRPSCEKDKKDRLDDYYLREDQLFLEPGDGRVRDHLIAIVGEIVKKYPEFGGVHLDYARYPSPTPFIAGSRFDSFGISYGYTENNLADFKKAVGLDVKKMNRSGENCMKWDMWRRDRVTELVKNISKKVRSLSPAAEISCAVVPSLERTHFVTFQDWPRWLRENIVNHVVMMNYSEDDYLVALRNYSVLFPGLEKRVHIGLGAYLIKNFPQLKEQIEKTRDLRPGGIVIFSYDDIAKNKKLREFLSQIS